MPALKSQLLSWQTLGGSVYGRKHTSALSMASVGHLEPVNLAFQTPSQELFWGKMQ